MRSRSAVLAPARQGISINGHIASSQHVADFHQLHNPYRTRDEQSKPSFYHEGLHKLTLRHTLIAQIQSKALYGGTNAIANNTSGT